MGHSVSKAFFVNANVTSFNCKIPSCSVPRPQIPEDYLSAWSCRELPSEISRPPSPKGDAPSSSCEVLTEISKDKICSHKDNCTILNPEVLPTEIPEPPSPKDDAAVPSSEEELTAEISKDIICSYEDNFTILTSEVLPSGDVQFTACVNGKPPKVIYDKEEYDILMQSRQELAESFVKDRFSRTEEIPKRKKLMEITSNHLDASHLIRRGETDFEIFRNESGELTGKIQISAGVVEWIGK